MISITEAYAREANDALLKRLTKALEDEDWDAVEATAWAIHDFARAYTTPGGANA